MSDPQDPYANPPGWTDPYEDLTDLSGDDPLPPMEPPTTPPAQPPGSPLLTGLIIGLLLVALSVAVFQLLRPDDEGTASEATTTTTIGDDSTTTTAGEGGTTTTVPGTTTTIPGADPYDPVPPPIPVERLKLIADGLRVNDNDIPDITFGTDAATAIGRLVASFGDPSNDTGWQVSTGQYGTCKGSLERVVFFGPFAAIVTKPNSQEIFDGYRHDLVTGDLSHEAAKLETLSGLKLGATVGELRNIYSGETVEFATDPKLGDIYQVIGGSSGNLLLWGPVSGTADDDTVIGIYAPDSCDR